MFKYFFKCSPLICQDNFNYAPREILINESPGSSSAQLVPA